MLVVAAYRRDGLVEGLAVPGARSQDLQNGDRGQSAATLPVPGVSCDPTQQNSMEESTFSTHTRGQLRPYLTSV